MSVEITDCNIIGNELIGIRISSTNPTVVRNCIIRGNSSIREGGGLYCSGPAEIDNCVISGNSSIGEGGGIYCSGHTEINNCIISDNIAAKNGGGVYLESHNFKGQSRVVNCEITGNTSAGHGGAACIYGYTEVLNCKISGNVAWDDGGGILGLDVFIEQCRVMGNTAGGVGGGLCVGGFTTIVHSYISGNSARAGGGVYMYVMNGEVSDSVIAGNIGRSYCGGFYASSKIGCGFLVNCTVAQNRGGPQSPVAGIMSYDVDISNCIVWGNETFGPWPPVQIGGGYFNNVHYVHYTCVEGGWQGVGNIEEEPIFVAPGYWDANGTAGDMNDDFWVDGDYRLRGDSPCIDAGDLNFIAGPNETDIDGNPRVIDGDEDGIARVDMGAFEYVPSIEAQVRIMPKVLNLRSNGNWIMCTIKLPPPCKIEEIDTNSVLLNERIRAEKVWVGEYRDVAIATFNRKAVEEILHPGEVELLVTGRLNEGQEFEGSDTIRVISGPKGPGNRGGKK